MQQLINELSVSKIIKKHRFFGDFYKYGPWHIGYLWTVGIIGWSLLIYTLYQTYPINLSEKQLQVLVAAIGTAFLCRALAFVVYDKVKISIDTCYYTAISFILGPQIGALIAAVALAGNSVIRLILKNFNSRVKEVRPIEYCIGQVLFDGGVPVIGIISTAKMHSISAASEYILKPYDLGFIDLGISIKLVGFTVSCLLLHYLIAAVASLVQGRAARGVFTRFYLGVLSYEITMIPLSVALLLGYTHQDIWYFLTLTASYIVCNFLCRKLADRNIIIHQRATELAILNDVGQKISSKLNIEDLKAVVAEYSHRLMHHSPSIFMIGLIDQSDHEYIEYTIFNDIDKQNNKKLRLRYNVGISGKVMAGLEPVIFSDVPAQACKPPYNISKQYIDSRYRSWMGIPLRIFNEPIGILTIQTAKSNAYTQNNMMTMQTIARQTEIAIQNAQLYQLATKDSLSKLYVRRYFDQRIIEEAARAKRNKKPLSLLMVDLDDFKKLNDCYGHLAGDLVIKDLGKVILNTLRLDDIPCRFGGEEFALILPNTTQDGAAVLAKRLVDNIRKMIINVDQNALSVTASIGVATMEVDQPVDSNLLIKMADGALYQAKADGKNCSRVYSSSVQLKEEFGEANSIPANATI